MARELNWSKEAAADLAEIYAYIARNSQVYAANQVQRIVTAVESLVTMPKRGRVVPEYRRQSIREVIVGSYRVIYRVTPAEVGVVGIIHGARILPRR